MDSNDHVVVPDPQPKRETIPEFIARGLAYCDAATDGPWEKNYVPDMYDLQDADNRYIFREPDGPYGIEGVGVAAAANADFCISSRIDLPRALKVLERNNILLTELLGAAIARGDDYCRELICKEVICAARILNGEEVDDG